MVDTGSLSRPTADLIRRCYLRHSHLHFRSTENGTTSARSRLVERGVAQGCPLASIASIAAMAVALPRASGGPGDCSLEIAPRPGEATSDDPMAAWFSALHDDVFVASRSDATLTAALQNVNRQSSLRSA